MLPAMTVSNDIRKAIDGSELSRYQIAKDAGVAQSTLSRFMGGKSMNIDALDRIAVVLKLGIVTLSAAGKVSRPRRSKGKGRR